MQHAVPLARLIDALRALPGVGPKTAQRMAFHLLQGGRDGAATLAAALTEGAGDASDRCKRCRMLTDDRAVLDLRGDAARCRAVVRGRVAGGCRRGRAVRQLSRPLLRAAWAICRRSTASARSRSVAREFEALLDSGEDSRSHPRHQSDGRRRSHGALPRRARGATRRSRPAASRTACPIGGELEYVDGGTLAHALAGRQAMG